MNKNILLSFQMMPSISRCLLVTEVILSLCCLLHATSEHDRPEVFSGRAKLRLRRELSEAAREYLRNAMAYRGPVDEKSEESDDESDLLEVADKREPLPGRPFAKWVNSGKRGQPELNEYGPWKGLIKAQRRVEPQFNPTGWWIRSDEFVELLGGHFQCMWQ